VRSPSGAAGLSVARPNRCPISREPPGMVARQRTPPGKAAKKRFAGPGEPSRVPALSAGARTNRGPQPMPTLQHANGALGCALTPREHQITALASAGLSNKEIARRLHLAEGTVKTHLHNVYQKARVNNRTALAARFHGRSSANTHDFMNAQPSQPGARSSEHGLLRSALVPTQRLTWP
jgi:DNA-binding CsgD family transcriptional regulator